MAVLSHEEGTPLKSLRSRAHRALIAALRDARKGAGITQQRLAARLKRPQSFVSLYESGERRLDVIEFLEIAAALKIDPCAILKTLR